MLPPPFDDDAVVGRPVVDGDEQLQVGEIVDDAGHSAFEPGIRSALLEATDKFAG